MHSLNRVELMGTLGADPELRVGQNGGAVLTLRVATHSSWRDKRTGERKKETEWHNCKIFNDRATTLAPMLRKGANVYIAGNLKTRKWQATDGTNRYAVEVMVNEFGFLDAPAGDRRQQRLNVDPDPQGHPMDAEDPGGPHGDDLPF